MPSKSKKFRYIFFLYWFLLAYILAALIFWFIALNRQNRQMTKYEMEQLDPADKNYQPALENIKSLEKRKTAQYLGEGVTFFLLIVALYQFFERTLYGKALRATAVNRRGARLVGIGTTQAGRLAFLLASTIGTLCGVLIAPLTTIYYDSGFLMGLKGFVGAIIGGLASYPLAAGGALMVGLLEAYSSFYASALKEVIVFTLIIPVLLWRSIAHPQVEEGEA